MAQSKIQLLHPASAAAPKSAAPPAGPARHTKVHRRRLIVLGCALLTICGVGGVQLFSTQQAITTKTAAVQDAKQSLTKVQTQKHNLKVQIDQLKNEEYLAKLVRQRYMMSKPGETVFSLPDPGADTQTTR
ncbi:FtsB family cell division protein [Lacticaseibacillus daqingensis]|uniref:FtsB family cell division protein n=1 Tax=Lacticaseibacillus daqingensis TaxID=2486014 RepID=UPI000F78D4C4|nr:septum formation initiator family protein [Lacticaseibacillus daqingensis]